MSELAILGHPTRGKEVIEILEMLGGKNIYACNAVEETNFYFIVVGEIDYDKEIYITDKYTVFTLEEFLEKFPYKTGDSVFVEGKECLITDVIWHNELNCIRYEVFHTTGSLTNGWYYVCNLQPYKEETMEETIKIDIPKGYEFTGVDDDNQQVVFTKIQPQYPKTCEECLKILGKTMNSLDNMRGYKYALFMRLQQLLISRDAYWKIAGEQMGLGKPFEPDWNDENETYYTISYDGVNIKCYNNTDVYSKLAFPTVEMRDAFYENFKSLIEECKELL